jgi:dynein heavy chain
MLLETYFVFAAIWAFGSTLWEKDGEDYRAKFSEWWRNTFRDVRLPSRESIFDYYMDPTELKFDKWEDSPYFSTVQYDSMKQPMSSVTVPTPETTSVSYWMELLLNAAKPVMLLGQAGCGKTQLIMGMLAEQNPDELVHSSINFNFFTDAETLQISLEAPLEKKTGTNYGPPGQSKLIYFVDDLNLPELDPYNTQSAIALLRQQMDYGHVYDRTKLTIKNFTGVQYIAAMNPTAGSFTVNPRLQRHFNTFAMGFPGPSSLYTIYNTFLQGHLQHFDEEVQAIGSNLLNAALQLHNGVAHTFRKSAKNFHYEFNIRHLSNVFQGILMAQPAEFKEPGKFASLWLHESERVYGDRLVSGEHLAKYQVLAQNQSKKKFANLQGVLGTYFLPQNAEPLIFCHFAESVAEKVYDKIKGMGRLRDTLEESLREYNETNAVMNLVLFEDAIRHVCRITRIINNPAGHALLVGVGGSGK